MSNGTVNGKKPLSSKPKPASTVPVGELFGNALAIPADVQRELDEKGYEGRWVDAQKLYAFSGYHPKEWVPYKQERKKDSGAPTDLKFGADPEGVIRRGTMILAVKRKEDAERHRAYLKHKASLVSNKQLQRAQAESLRKMARDHGADMTVDEGYEDDIND